MTPEAQATGIEEALRRIEKARGENLAELDLSNLGLSEVPEPVCSLAGLRNLKLQGNQIAAIPGAIEQLVNLWYLNLNDNQVAEIPEAVGRLTELRQLQMRRNQIVEIPVSVCRLPGLQFLYLAENRIPAIPEEIGNLPALTALELDSNPLGEIPEILWNMVGLELLHLGNIQVNAIPEGLSRLINLESFAFYSNGIDTIPDSLGALVKLEGLYLSSNQIAAIPETLCTLVNLRILHLAYNKIAAVPDSLGQLVKLSEISLKGNPLPEPLLAASALGAESLLRYLKTARRVRPRTVKLVLLGEPKSGKTTLLEALKGNLHPCAEDRPETIGVKPELLQRMHPGDGKPMSLSVWDFAGQHIEHATHQFFLTEQAIYLILWNARKGAESGNRDIWYWLELLKMRVREPRFLLVATHVENTPPDLNLSDVAQGYPGLQGCHPVELSTLRGFDALERQILELAADSPSMRAEWRPELLRVRNAIREMSEHQPYIAVEEFRRLLSAHEITGETEQTEAAGQLNILGEIVYFQDRDELAGIVILDPGWVTELVALVVRNRGVHGRGGILEKNDLNEIWRNHAVPADVREHLLNLMDRFDLTYATHDRVEIGIVVEALGYSTPDQRRQIETGPGKRHMEMIYRFPSSQRHLPPGIPTWTFARAHRFLKGQPWRDVALFEHPVDGSEASILASDLKKELRLRVSGEYPPFFFGVLQDILFDTFRRYRGVEPEMHIPCSCQPNCQGTYPFKSLLQLRNRGKTEIPCLSSFTDVSIESLLTGFPRPDAGQGLEAVRAEMRLNYTKMLRALQEQNDKACPSVFTLLPVREFKQLDTWIESMTKQDQLELVLYCEADSGWHTTGNSVYRFSPDQEWLDRLKAHWNVLARLTRQIAPLAKPLAKAQGIDIPDIPEIPRSAPDQFASALGQTKSPREIDFETRGMLKQLIEILDRERSATETKYGGLFPQLVEDGRRLWLCPDHKRPYQPATRAGV